MRSNRCSMWEMVALFACLFSLSCMKKGEGQEYKEPYGLWRVYEMSPLHISDGISEADNKTVGQEVRITPGHIDAKNLGGKDLSCELVNSKIVQGSIFESELLSPSLKNRFACERCGFGERINILRSEARIADMTEIVFDEKYQRMFVGAGGAGFILIRKE